MKHVYEIRLGKDKRGIDLTSGALPAGRLWYSELTQSQMQSTTRSIAAAHTKP